MNDWLDWKAGKSVRKRQEVREIESAAPQVCAGHRGRVKRQRYDCVSALVRDRGRLAVFFTTTPRSGPLNLFLCAEPQTQGLASINKQALCVSLPLHGQ